MATFQRKARTTGISRQMTLGGWTFDAQAVISEKNGNPAAIHCGRILCFQMNCEDEIIAYFEDGVWYQTPDPDFEEGLLAMESFICEMNAEGANRWADDENEKKNDPKFCKGKERKIHEQTR